MLTQQSVQNAEYRLAQHYLARLQQTAAVNPRGVESLQHALHAVRQDWDQIIYWQAWAAAGAQNHEEARAKLCLAFSLTSSPHIRMHQLPAETLHWAQQALNAARMLNDGAAERELLYVICRMHLSMDDIQAVEQHAEQLAERAAAAHDAVDASRAWGMLGRVKERRAEYDDAETFLQRSLVFSDSYPPQELLSLWQALGRIALVRGDYPLALQHHLRVLESARVARLPGAASVAHLSLSGLLVYQGDYAEAEHHAEQAVSLAQRIGFMRLIPATYLALAHARKWLGKYEEALVYYEKALAQRDLLAPANVVNALYGSAHLAFFRGHLDTALSHLQEALAQVQSFDLAVLCDVSRDLVFVYVARNESAAALPHLKCTLQTAQQLNTEPFMAKALAAAITYCAHTSQVEKAAVWAAVVQQYVHQLRSTLFDAAVYGRLEAALGAERYDDALSMGRTRTLNAAVADALRMLQ